ncbi:hypothetical protein [Brumimicrobium mesophilum]|uniref:hypothetical protein n=1 Tax=Brumimicrobium mesophilum TaxID=392717 RepID=UPI000D14098B|nr:hypothetical protein [Brumimicrobium mesophilum]
MKSILFIISALISSTLFAECNTEAPSQQTIDDSSFTFILNLQIGDSVEYKTYLSSCLSGDRPETMDSVCFYRDSLNLKAIYKNTIYPINSDAFDDLQIIESKLLTIGTTSSTSYYNYIISYQGKQGLLGFGTKNTWNEIIHFITDI